MDHNPQLYNKIQELYEKYWEIKSGHHKDSDYYPIIELLENILYEHPDNEYALQLKIIVKQSYRNKPKDELRALCEHMRRINPNNQFANGIKKLKFKNNSNKTMLIFHIISLIILIIMIISMLCTSY